MDFQKLKRSILIGIIIGIVVFAGISIYSDFNQLVKVFTAFDYRYIPLILILAPLNYCFRFVKWTYYLKQIGVSIPVKDNLLIFMSGLSMTITPGKVGELLKSYLLKERANVPISSTAPLIMAERLTDGISMLMLASVGALSYNYGKGILLLVLLGMLCFIAILQSPRLIHGLIRILNKISLMKRFGASIENFYNKTYTVLKLKPLLFAIAIGVVSWFFEGLVIYLTVQAMGIEFPLLASIFTVAFSSIVGALSMMPGGLFAAEGSILGLLIMMGLPKDIAAATTIITRFSTLWLGVVIGLLGLVLVQKRREE